MHNNSFIKHFSWFYEWFNYFSPSPFHWTEIFCIPPIQFATIQKMALPYNGTFYLLFVDPQWRKNLRVRVRVYKEQIKDPYERNTLCSEHFERIIHNHFFECVNCSLMNQKKWKHIIEISARSHIQRWFIIWRKYILIYCTLFLIKDKLFLKFLPIEVGVNIITHNNKNVNPCLKIYSQ